MEISKKLDYALRMLAEVAKVQGGSVVSVRQVAEENGIPYSFARTIQHEMVRSGLLKTTRGPHGGMMLAVDADKTTLLDIVEAVDGPLMSVDLLKPTTSDANQSTGFEPIWQEIEMIVRGYLSSVTLHQVVVEGLAPMLVNGHFECIPVGELKSLRASQE